MPGVPGEAAACPAACPCGVAVRATPVPTYNPETLVLALACVASVRYSNNGRAAHRVHARCMHGGCMHGGHPEGAGQARPGLARETKHGNPSHAMSECYEPFMHRLLPRSINRINNTYATAPAMQPWRPVETGPPARAKTK